MNISYLFYTTIYSLFILSKYTQRLLPNKNTFKLLINKYSEENWVLGKNKFFNMTFDEFSKYKGYKNYNNFPHSTYNYNKNDLTPESWDWREHGIVGPIKNQQQCGSCWAFSAIGSLESQISKKTGKNISLSEQEMVDCVKNIESPDGTFTCCDGCMGGEMYSVYQYLIEKTKGVDNTESQYPYTAVDGECNKKLVRLTTKVNNFVSLPKGDEAAMVHALYTIGPLSIGVNANTDWQLYKKGIYNPSNETCDPEGLDHGVVLVGYGIENGVNYWTIRNSWGQDWGEDGYIRLVRGKNACGVSNAVIYPVIN